MDYYRSSIKLIISIVLLFHCQQGTAQYDQSMLDSNYRATLSFGCTFQHFFDGSPTIEWDQSEEISFGQWSNIGIFTDLIVEVNEMYSAQATVAVMSISYGGQCFQCGDRGDVIIRKLNLFSLKMRRNLLSDIRVNIDGIGGLQYRHGSESEIVSYGTFDTHLLTHDLSDVGLLVGVDVYRDIIKSRIRLSASITHTEYLYRKSRGQDSPYHWDGGSSRRMMQFLFSIGYNFGQIPFKE